jgi:sugar lactone lactonase YvrE
MRFRRIAVLLLAVVLMAGIPGAVATGLIPYDTYNYDYWENIVFTPAAYVPGGSVTGVDLGIGAFNKPEGMCVAGDGTVYVADTSNNRIVVIDRNLRDVVMVIDSFKNDLGGVNTFRNPRGVSVNNDGDVIYVADTNNRRVVALVLEETVETGSLYPYEAVAVKIIRDPQSDVIDEDFDFLPAKVAVDFAGRVFVTVLSRSEGIMAFNQTGDFVGYYGTIPVNISLWQRFWLFIATQEERDLGRRFIPTDFTGLDVDHMGFIYTCNIDVNGVQAVRRLNPSGEDVIRMGDTRNRIGGNRNLGGDINQYTTSSSENKGPSEIIDVVYRGSGIYSTLDRKRGRIFTYDHEGNLLYIFGGMGDQTGTFYTPTAIGSQILGDDRDRMLALDARRNEVMIFEQTAYGQLINRAVSLRYDGEESEAVDTWKQVLEIHETFELANAGIGKAYLTAGDNEAALHYLRLGMDKRHYAIAFRRYRNEILRDNLHWIFTGGLVLIVGFAAWRIFRRRKLGAASGSEGGLV